MPISRSTLLLSGDSGHRGSRNQMDVGFRRIIYKRLSLKTALPTE